MRRFLVAIDFSAIGRTVLEEAVQLAREVKGELHVLHVASLDSYQDLPDVTHIALDQHLENLQSRIRHWASKAGSGGTPLRVEVMPGDAVAEGILLVADQVSADLIVMGSHGRTGLARVVLGSIAESVLRRAKRPVLIIPMAAVREREPAIVAAPQKAGANA